jgi:hypothetical protein
VYTFRNWLQYVNWLKLEGSTQAENAGKNVDEAQLKRVASRNTLKD